MRKILLSSISGFIVLTGNAQDFATRIKNLEQRSGKPLSVIVGPHLASLSSEELKDFDSAINSYVGGTSNILDELEKYAKVESSGQKVGQLPQSKPEDAPLYKSIQELENETGKPLSGLIGEHLYSLSPDDLNKLHAMLRHYTQSGLLGPDSEETINMLEIKLSETPLHRAIQNNKLEEAKRLIEGGANVNAKDINGWTPLWDALDNPAALDLLLNAKADVNTSNKWGVTPLQSSADQGNESAVRRLIDAGADVNAQDEDNETPLRDAASQGYTSIVEMLIGAGADAALKDNKGKTALDYAHEGGHTDIVNILADLPKHSLNYITKQLKKQKKQAAAQAATKATTIETTNNQAPIKPQWAIDASGNAIYTDSEGKQQTISAQLSTIVASPDGSQVWGIDSQNKIYYRTGITRENPEGKDWVIVPGLLKQIVISPDNNIWAINMGGAIFFTNKNTDANPPGIGWQFIPGYYLSSIAVSDDGQITGITLDGKEVKRLGITKDNPMGTSWEVAG